MNFSSGSLLLITLLGADQNGNPFNLAGSTATWSSSDPAIFNPTPAADTLSAAGTAAKDGTVTITATIGNVSGSVAITVTAGQLATLTLTVSLTEQQPPTPPTP